MTAPTRRAMLGATLGAAALAAPGATTARPDAKLLALCARIEAVRRQINGRWLQGIGPRFYLPVSYVEDDDERDAALAPLEAQEAELIAKMMDHPPTTIEGVRAIARCLALGEPDLRAPDDETDMATFGLSSQGETTVLWLVDTLTGGEIRPATCMAEPGQLLVEEAGDGNRTPRYLMASAAEHPDAELIAACAEHPRNIAACNATEEDPCAKPPGPVWQAYDRTRDIISDAKPQTMEGLLAKAEAAVAEGPCSPGSESWEGSFAGTWARDVVLDLLRLHGRAV